jgi:hypothetical protein
LGKPVGVSHLPTVPPPEVTGLHAAPGDVHPTVGLPLQSWAFITGAQRAVVKNAVHTPNALRLTGLFLAAARLGKRPGSKPFQGARKSTHQGDT